MTPTLRTAILDALMERWREGKTQDWTKQLEPFARKRYSYHLNMILPVAEPMIREAALQEAAEKENMKAHRSAEQIRDSARDRGRYNIAEIHSDLARAFHEAPLPPPSENPNDQR